MSPDPMPGANGPLRGALVFLRPWERGDLDLRHRWLSDGELLGYLEESVPS
jgi:hypothetical protein